MTKDEVFHTMDLQDLLDLSDLLDFHGELIKLET
jgi:hypothetical protein